MPSVSRPAALSGRAYAWYVLLVLCVANLFASLDRYAFFVFVEPIKREFQASDTAIGVITGIAFILTYVVLGVPLARWVDRGNRRTILALAVAVWSLITAAGALAGSIVQLGLTRAGLGAGEAAATPASTSLIADYFPASSRHVAISVFQSGMAFSGILGAPFAGMVASAHGWRMALVAMGLPGLLVALLVLVTVREPQRGAMDAQQAASSAPNHSWTEIRALLGNRAYLWLLISQLAVGFATGILPVWLPVYLMRSYRLSLAQMGALSGYLNGAVMLAAFTLAGFVTLLVRGRLGNRWLALMPALASVVAVPLLLAALAPMGLSAVIVSATLFYLMLFATRPAALTLSTELVGGAQRGMAAALIVMASSLFGAGGGNLLVGVISDLLSPAMGNVRSLRVALMVTVPGAMAFCAIAFYGCFLCMGNRQRRGPYKSDGFSTSS